ncbi:hypothetical protein BDR04DRAFT_1086587 [Suillus decipiens]|nr:hypothetical protein BDR04DRAFT_1086587 [Suillus decipiens]
MLFLHASCFGIWSSAIFCAPGIPLSTFLVSCLHLTLRTFMVLEDYSAALIMLRAFDYFRFQLNLQTYLIVITSLALRMKHELGHVCRAAQYRFADLVMHMRPGEPPDVDVLQWRIQHGEPTVKLSGPACVGPETVTHLLTLGESNSSSRSQAIAHIYYPNCRHALRSYACPTIPGTFARTARSTVEKNDVCKPF